MLLISSIIASDQADEYVVRSTVSTCLNVRLDHKQLALFLFGVKSFSATINRGWVAKKFLEPATTVAEVTDPANVTIPDDAILMGASQIVAIRRQL